MKPVRLKIICGKDDCAECPGKWISPENHVDDRNEMYCNGYIGYPNNAPAQQHDQHGHPRTPRAPENSGQTVGVGQQEVKEGNRVGLDDAIPDHLRVAVEGADEQRRKNIYQNANRLGNGYRAQDTEPGAFFGPVIFLRSKILADKGSKGHDKAVDRQEAEALNLGVGAAAGHGHFAEGVDIGLHHHIGKGDDGVLQARREPVTDYLAEQPRVKADFGDLDPVFLLCPRQTDKTEKSAQKLGDYRSQRGASHTQVQHSHKEQVKRHVDHGGENQVVQGMLTVAHGLQDAHKNIVEDESQGAAEINAEISDGGRENIGGRSHKLQDKGREDNAHGRQRDSGYNTQGHGGVYGQRHPFLVSCPKIPGDNYPRPHSDTVKKAHQQENQAAGGADRRKGVASYKITHNQGICGIVKLLEQIAQKQWKCKCKYFAPDRPLCQERGGSFCLAHGFLRIFKGYICRNSGRWFSAQNL